MSQGTMAAIAKGQRQCELLCLGEIDLAGQSYIAVASIFELPLKRAVLVKICPSVTRADVAD